MNSYQTAGYRLFDLFLITAKMHIYYCKFQATTPNLDGFIRRINNFKYITKRDSFQNNVTYVYNQNWFITNDEVDPT